MSPCQQCAHNLYQRTSFLSDPRNWYTQDRMFGVDRKCMGCRDGERSPASVERAKQQEAGSRSAPRYREAR